MKIRILMSLLVLSSTLIAGEINDQSLSANINKFVKSESLSNAVECTDQLVENLDSSCDINEYEGDYVLDECEGEGRWFPRAVVKVHIKPTNGKLDVSYDTASWTGFGNRGANIGYGRIFLNPERKQQISNNGCQVQRRIGFRNYDRIAMDPSTKVVTLSLKDVDFQEDVTCTLKRAED